MPETGLRFRGLALGGRAQHSGEGVRGALRLDLEPRRVSGVRRRDAPPRFLDLLAVVGVVGVALAVDLVTDHLGLCAAEHHQGREAACQETQALIHRRTSSCLAGYRLTLPLSPRSLNPGDRVGDLFGGGFACTAVACRRRSPAAVAGSDAVARPRILDLAPSYSAVRISGVKYDTGTTAGYWEALYRIGRGRRVTLRGAAADRVSDLSARALAVVTEAERLLFVPVQLLYDEQRDAFRKPLARAQARLRALLDHESLQAVLDLVADPPNTEAEQIALHAMAARGLRVIWQETASTVPDPLRVARATLELSRRLQNAFQENLMTAPEMSTLAKRVHAVLYSMDAHLTPDNRARIRSAATNLPLDAYVALAEVPADEMEQLVTRRVWETAIRGLSVVHQGGPSVGDVLAGTDYPAARVSALLSSRHPGRPHRRGREVARVARRRAGVAHRLSRSRPRRCQQ